MISKKGLGVEVLTKERAGSQENAPLGTFEKEVSGCQETQPGWSEKELIASISP